MKKKEVMDAPTSVRYLATDERIIHGGFWRQLEGLTLINDKRIAEIRQWKTEN